VAAPKAQKQLLALFDSLPAQAQQALLDYAEFLKARYPVDIEISHEPQDISRPGNETVVLAIRRLSKTYPMLDREALLHETSSFMMQHIVQGKQAREVIDDLEVYFRQQYEDFVARQGNA